MRYSVSMMMDIKYLLYMCRHKWFVFLQCVRYGIIWRGLFHDFSKFRPDEWVPYRDYFYGEKIDKTRVQGDLDRAWLEHIHRNSHHWQHYILHNDDGSRVVLRMPWKDILEMVADWVGAEIAIHGKIIVWDWYKVNQDNMELHSETRVEVEALVEKLRVKYSGEMDSTMTNDVVEESH